MENTIAIFAALICVSTSSADEAPQKERVIVSEWPNDAELRTKNKLLQFIFTAKTGVIAKTDNEKEPYKLTLKNVSDDVVFFTNAPRRVVGNMATDFFLKRWEKPEPNSFTVTPPNIGITFSDKGSRLQTLVLELTEPSYDRKAQTLSFNAKPTLNEAAMPSTLSNVTVSYASPAVCGLLGSWGNLPGEKQYDESCHQQLQKQ